MTHHQGRTKHRKASNAAAMPVDAIARRSESMRETVKRPTLLVNGDSSMVSRKACQASL